MCLMCSVRAHNVVLCVICGYSCEVWPVSDNKSFLFFAIESMVRISQTLLTHVMFGW